MHNDDGVQISQPPSTAFHHTPHCGNQPLRRSPARQRLRGNNWHRPVGVRQRDTAFAAAGIHQKKTHHFPSLASPTISTRTPPVLAGCTKKYWCPPAPVCTESLASLTPCCFICSNIASSPSTCTAMWWSPSPRFSRNRPITESVSVGSNSSIRLSPRGSIAVLTFSCSTVSSCCTLSPRAS